MLRRRSLEEEQDSGDLVERAAEPHAMLLHSTVLKSFGADFFKSYNGRCYESKPNLLHAREYVSDATRGQCMSAAERQKYTKHNLTLVPCFAQYWQC